MPTLPTRSAALRLPMLMLAAGTAVATAAPTDVLTVEDVVSLRSVRDAALQPGGRLAAYVLSVPRDGDDEPGGPRSEIWLLDLDTGANRRFTAEGESSSSPQWSPDGAHLAFLSKRADRSDETQIFLIPVDGGEPSMLTEHDSSVGSIRFSPNGGAIAFTARDPEPADRAEREEAGEDWVVVDAERRFRRLYTVEVATGEVRRVDEGELDIAAFEWTADGRTLVVQASMDPRIDDNMMNSGLYRVPTAGGAPVPICPTEGKLGDFAISPEGGTLAFLGATDRSDPLPQSLFIVPLDGSDAPRLATSYEGSIRQVEWIDDVELLMLADEGTGSALRHVPVEGGEGRVVARTRGGVRSIDLDGESGRISAVADAPHHPPEVWSASLRAPDLRRLTDHNPRLADVDLARTETVEWTGPDGWRIEGVLTYPVDGADRNGGTGGPHPLIVNPHGGPEGVTQDGWNAMPQLLAARGFLVLQPNYRGSGGRGVGFSKGDHDDLGGREFEDILTGIDALVETGLADPDRVGMGGWSYGGYLSAMAATHHSARFVAAVMGAGISNWVSFTGTTDIPDEMSTVHWNRPMIGNEFLYWQRSPLYAISAANTPTLILYGAGDERVPPSQGRELHHALRSRGVPTQMVLYPRAGHGVAERAHRIDLLSRQLRWFERYVQSDGG